MKLHTLLSLEKILAEEHEFSNNNYNGTYSSRGFNYKIGSVPILFSAPHTVNTLFQNKPKLSEPYTGSLLKILNEFKDVHCIYKTFNDGKNPNFDDNCIYKETVIDIIRKYNIKYVLDIHGMSESRPYDIDIGTHFEETIQHQSFIQLNIKQIFQNNHLNAKINKLFHAESNYTVTRYTSNHSNIPCLQIEINRKYRDPVDYPSNFLTLIQSFFEIIEYIKTH